MTHPPNTWETQPTNSGLDVAMFLQVYLWDALQKLKFCPMNFLVALYLFCEERFTVFSIFILFAILMLIFKLKNNLEAEGGGACL